MLLFKGLYTNFLQKLVVEPNELSKEEPYIKNSIYYTRKAYNLDKIQHRKIPSTLKDKKISFEDIDPITLNNIRLWDYQPLLSTYKQIQEIRLYYKFTDVDINRIPVNNQYRQVAISAREMSYNQLPEKAKTWVNQRLKYTHGYGIVMSPINRTNKDGLPELYIKDIPPVSNIDITINRPEIYYGEETDHYIFTGTKTQEFDYPAGDKNEYNYYEGNGGVSMQSLFRKIAFTLKYRSTKILFSDYFSENTKVHYVRNIKKRIKKIAPFLSFDNDPFISISNGKLYWIIDGYTTSNFFPYSNPVRSGSINYIRNSVKVVVDAYNGDVQFYVFDTEDPIIKTYQKVFPKLFLPKEQIPKELKNQMRYPVDMFYIQSYIYLTYHMEDPVVFYNREDKWSFAKEIKNNVIEDLEPYYITMKLPSSKKAELLLILPLTPSNKDNMIAWMAALSDGENYGKIVLYEFPKKEIIFWS